MKEKIFSSKTVPRHIPFLSDMSKKSRGTGPQIKPVETIEVEQKNFTLRVVLLLVFLALGISAIAYACTHMSADRSGWQRVELDPKTTENCSDEFTFLYQFGQGDLQAREEYRKVAAIYEEAAVKAYRLFHERETFQGVKNVAYLNQNPNEATKVDPVLYQALEKITGEGGRSLYLAPIYSYYRTLFFCRSDEETRYCDPFVSREVEETFREILEYAGDEEEIELELLGENRVRLKVSEDYLRYAKEKDEKEFKFIDFQWMKNAFIVDYFAERMKEEGFTKGAISSCDGFCRNLDEREITYSLNLFDRVGEKALCPAVLQYQGPMSAVSLHTFSLGEEDDAYYYEREDGELRFPYLDESDGFCRAAGSNLTCYSKKLGCAELLFRMIPAFVKESFSPELLRAGEGLEAVWCRDGTINYTEKGAIFDGIYHSETVSYTLKEVPPEQ